MIADDPVGVHHCRRSVHHCRRLLCSIGRRLTNADDLGRGLWLLVAYSIGLGIPFLIAAAWAGQFSAWLRRYGHLRRYAGPLAGGFLVVIGVLLFTDSLAVLATNGAVADLQVHLDEGAITLWQQIFGGGAQ
jgi:hypothetical protein